MAVDYVFTGKCNLVDVCRGYHITVEGCSFISKIASYRFEFPNANNALVVVSIAGNSSRFEFKPKCTYKKCCNVLFKYEDILNERRKQLIDSHRTQLERLEHEHERNMKNILQRHEDLVIDRRQFGCSVNFEREIYYLDI
jgi:hypothetical protein